MVRNSLDVLRGGVPVCDLYGRHGAAQQVGAVRSMGTGRAAPEACCDDVTALVATYPECSLGLDLVWALADHIERCERCARFVGVRAEAAWVGSPAWR